MTDTATVNILLFMQKTAEDETLQAELEALLGVGDGNISCESELDSEEAAVLKGSQAPVVAEFATSQGFAFTAADLVAVVEAFEQHQAGSLSDEEFTAFLGTTLPDTTHDDHAAQVTNPLKRLSRYLGKTYLGLGANTDD
ncbi:hypothetical protein [Synechococcus sp. PCC 6312]|uniref:hypothetical protein n=1 Tax=Synechococcus sp. (strain ATCC 27167 / PCC 6312) TaxID=195253 RepID=UPI00029F1AB3|nr:hypothetical protein [Synechococcus sp. PCC 6312]AFY60543.1 hypothetical protein Syn6312_1372 [Synechococcus sp. PCC 6312]